MKSSSLFLLLPLLVENTYSGSPSGKVVRTSDYQNDFFLQKFYFILKKVLVENIYSDRIQTKWFGLPTIKMASSYRNFTLF